VGLLSLVDNDLTLLAITDKIQKTVNAITSNPLAKMFILLLSASINITDGMEMILNYIPKFIYIVSKTNIGSELLIQSGLYDYFKQDK